MKRGIVMEIKRNKAVILTKNGVFQTIRFNKKQGIPDVGEEMIIPAVRNTARPSKHWLPAIAALAVIFIFVILLSGFYPSSPDKTVAAYVSYDVNPSFSAAVNADMQVVSVKTWNKDAADLFTDWDSYQFMALKKFSNEVLRKFAQSGYLHDHPQILMAMAIVANDNYQKDQITSSLQKVMKKVRSDSLIQKNDVQLNVRNSDPKIRKKANESGLSLGKYLLYLDAAANDENLSISTVKQLSVSDIHKKIKQESKTGNNLQKDSLQATSKNQSQNDSNPNNHKKSNDHKKEKSKVSKKKNAISHTSSSKSGTAVNSHARGQNGEHQDSKPHYDKAKKKKNPKASEKKHNRKADKHARNSSKNKRKDHGRHIGKDHGKHKGLHKKSSFNQNLEFKHLRDVFERLRGKFSEQLCTTIAPESALCHTKKDKINR